MRNIGVRVAVTATAAVLMVGAGLPQTAQAAALPGTYVAVTPTRLLDTRSGTGAPKAKIGAGKALVLQIGGKAGVPTSGVSAVALNLNAVNSTATGRIIAYAAGSTRPNISSVNFVAGRPGTSLVVSRVSTAGKVALYNTSSQPVDLIADLSGYFTAGTVTTPGGFVPVAPSRSLDTRNAIGADRQDLFGNGTSPDTVDFTWQVAGRNGVPTTGAAAAVMSVTITNATIDDVLAPYPSQYWNLMQWPDDNSLSTLNGMSFVAGRPVTNLYVVPLGADGRVRMSQTSGNGGTFDVIADVVGYTRSGIVTTPGAYQVAPSRSLGWYTIAAGATVTTKAIADPGAVVPLNLTVRAGATAGALIAYEAGTVRPTATRNVNFTAGERVSNTVIVKTNAAGALNLTNSSASTITVAVDAAGYFRGTTPAANTLWTTGSNGWGQLAASGLFSWGSDLIAPGQLAGIKRLYAGDYEHGISVSYALMPNGTVRAWGSWGYRSMSGLTGNPLGIPGTAETSVPTQVPQIANVIDVAASTGGAFFLQNDGTVWGTGDGGQEGQLMNTVPEESGVNSPVKLPGLTGITSIGRQFAAKADGSVVTWDRTGVRNVPGISDAADLNDSYALRAGGTVARLTPTGAISVTGLSNVIAINNRYALTSTGTVWRLPNQTVTLRQVDGLSNVTTLGSYGPAALKADGSVWIWDDVFTATKVANVPPMSLAYKNDSTTGSWETLFMVSR